MKFNLKGINTNSIKMVANNVAFTLKKNAPTILSVGGAIGVAAGFGLTIRATRKVDAIFEEQNEVFDKIEQVLVDDTIEYTQDDADHDRWITYGGTVGKLIRLYALPVVMTVGGVAMLLKSNQILNKRNGAIMAAYAALDNSFRGYRNRVKERFGEEVENEIYYNIHKETITTTEVNAKGKEKEVSKEINVTGIDASSAKLVCFDKTNPNFQDDCRQYTKMFLDSQEAYANQLLQSRGYLFLNDVFEGLGLPKTKAGQVLGWRYDPKDETLQNCVKFSYGLDDIMEDFLAGLDDYLLIDFNVDGVIWDKACYDK